MLKEIFSGNSHSFDTGLAFHLQSIEAAVVFNNLYFWLKLNKSKSINQIEGRTWVFETAHEMSKIFGYLNERQVKYSLRKLVESGILIRENFNKNPFDKTSWYALSDESLLDFKEIPTKDKIVLSKNKIVYRSDKIVPSDRTKLSDPQNKIVPSYMKDNRIEDIEYIEEGEDTLTNSSSKGLESKAGEQRLFENESNFNVTSDNTCIVAKDSSELTKSNYKFTNDSNSQLNNSKSYSPPILTLFPKRFNIFLTEDQHNILLKNFGPELLEKAYDIVSDRKLTRDYSKTTDFHLLQRKWVIDAIQEQELKDQEIKSRKEKLKKKAELPSAESNRLKIVDFLSDKHNLLRSNNIDMIAGNKKVKINNDEIYYDDPKFIELIQHSLRKVGL